ncbi:hypothetical protein [Pseudobacteroides cellulosolvens]|uniref:Elongation factor Ts n=1 Tax=Pseudobacteroides cellulosolvens ATCC 35603 = DSM 2933 TaxID=398512 RepID=A0A0L6JID1_9FIRM|nr:hypothetical protein [Pseudobacteroides cellulosolvens]KNY25494.1 Elongation factor Ts [Pseudobacteroides cellulosolvens ATCC 35603 = DSM 2933]
MSFQGIIDARVHNNRKIGVLIEIKCTDCNTHLLSTSNIDRIKAFISELSFHIAAVRPLYLSKNDIPLDVLTDIKDFHRNKAVLLCTSKSADIIEKAVNGWLNKFFIRDVCLLEQRWIKDKSKTIGNLLNEVSALIGKSLYIKTFAWFEIGETLEVDYKKLADFYY